MDTGADSETLKRDREEGDTVDDVQSKRKKAKRPHKDALPDGRVPPSTSLLPASDPSENYKHQVDYRVTVEGIVRSVTVQDGEPYEVHFDLASRPTPSEDALASIHVALRGRWAKDLVNQTLLCNDATLAVSFKEAKYAVWQKSECNRSSWQLLYTRGCKLWKLQGRDDQAQDQWIHNCTFAAAQAEVATLDKEERLRRETTTCTVASGDDHPPYGGLDEKAFPRHPKLQLNRVAGRRRHSPSITASLPNTSCAHLREAKGGEICSTVGVVINAQPPKMCEQQYSWCTAASRLMMSLQARAVTFMDSTTS